MSPFPKRFLSSSSAQVTQLINSSEQPGHSAAHCESWWDLKIAQNSSTTTMQRAKSNRATLIPVATHLQMLLSGRDSQHYFLWVDCDWFKVHFQRSCPLICSRPRPWRSVLVQEVRWSDVFASCSIFFLGFSRWKFLFVPSLLLWTTQLLICWCQTNGCCGSQHKRHHFLCASKI